MNIFSLHREYFYTATLVTLTYLACLTGSSLIVGVTITVLPLLFVLYSIYAYPEE